MTRPSAYNGNQQLKAAGVEIEWTEDNISEWIKCQADPIYFIENYIKIVSIDTGVVPMILFKYQKDIVDQLKNNRKTAAVICRQAGKCVTGDTLINIRNKKTGEIKTISMSEFHTMHRRTIHS